MRQLTSILIFISLILTGYAVQAQPNPEMTPVVEKPVSSPTSIVTKPEIKPKAESKTEKIIDIVFKILTGIVSLIISLLSGFGYMRWVKKERVQKILKFAQQAFPAVEALVKKTDNKIDDKLVAFVGMINDMLLAEGQKAMNKTETDIVEKQAKASALAEKLKS